MEKTIAVLGGDRRMALLARLLAEDGHPVRTWGLAAFGMEDTALEEAAQADRVVLPVPLSRGKNLNCTATALPLCFQPAAVWLFELFRKKGEKTQ